MNYMSIKTVLFLILPNWKEHRCPINVEVSKQIVVCSVCEILLSNEKKKNKQQFYKTTLVKHQNILLRKRSQTKKGAYLMIPLL